MEEIEGTYKSPHGLQKALSEIESLKFTAQRLRRSIYDVKNQWEEKVKEMEMVSQQDWADTYRAQV